MHSPARAWPRYAPARRTGDRVVMKLLLTGGCGFIGSAVIRHLVRRTPHIVVNVDKMTYAASEDALEEARTHARHQLVRLVTKVL